MRIVGASRKLCRCVLATGSARRAADSPLSARLAPKWEEKDEEKTNKQRHGTARRWEPCYQVANEGATDCGDPCLPPLPNPAH